MQTPNGGEFLAPTDGISCEVNFRRSGLTSTSCQTTTPPRSATLSANGNYTTCSGDHCLRNPSTTSPTLPYGSATGAGPYRCSSAPAGVTCIANGKGFRISKAGISPATSLG